MGKVLCLPSLHQFLQASGRQYCGFLPVVTGITESLFEPLRLSQPVGHHRHAAAGHGFEYCQALEIMHSR